MGWTRAPIHRGDDMFKRPGDGWEAMLWHARDLPDLTLDLMAQVEETLDATQQAAYYSELYHALHRGHMSLRHQQWLPVIRATKEQRLEAYLKTKGLWREGA